MALDRESLERWLFGVQPGRRRTQDSPVLPDVWFAYGVTEPEQAGPDEPLVADARHAATVSPGPPERVDLLLRPHAASGPAALAAAVQERLASPAADTLVAANDAFVACLLTLDELLGAVLPLSHWWRLQLWPGKRGAFAEHVAPHRELLAEHLRGHDGQRVQGRRAPDSDELPGDVIWLVGLVGRIAWEHRQPSLPADEAVPRAADVVDAALQVLGPLELGRGEGTPPLWNVSRNRPIRATVWRSRLACKADAATRLFSVSCRDVRWAVVDSGIDARHPAFARRIGDDPVDRRPPEDGTPLDPAVSAASRIVATYDFLGVRTALAQQAGAVHQAVRSGRVVDWDVIAPQLQVKHDASYAPPRHDHGTHVAGVLGGDWRPDDLPPPPAGGATVAGMCPDIELYDLRAIAGDEGDEFTVLSALQFIRHLNMNADLPVIHGANLSFATPHLVDQYAAGRTPVCDEANRLVASGVVVVAAAGNSGRGGYVVRGRSVDGYRTVSITDPGNAEDVITVGATHRDRPHTYGVSFFSSRGPTGDGRSKPDVVAPGEKITAPVPDSQLQTKDGTSQAAPHVSGACALLLARHPELIGDPGRVKRVIRETCTDLGREHQFQGAGMIDVLRAMQAV